MPIQLDSVDIQLLAEPSAEGTPGGKPRLGSVTKIPPATKPTPISEKEVQNILHQIQEGVEKPRPKVLFEVGEAVRVKEGPFTDFHK